MSKDISTSPDRHTFQAKKYVERCEAEGTEPREDYLNLYVSAKQQDADNMTDPAWRENNLEYDLRSTQWILDKARASESYAQNIYAALCNMRWQKREVLPVLKDEYWSCSWRSAGGVVAHLRQEGDYMDWYCSGMGGMATYDYEDDQKRMNDKGYVPEGRVTQEIEDDFYKLGWVHSEWPEDGTV